MPHAQDFTGQLAANKITNEVISANSPSIITHSLIIPAAAPFYKQYFNNLGQAVPTFLIRHVSADGSITTPMVEGVDYVFSLEYNAASTSLGNMVYGGITLLVERTVGTYKLDYQTIGGTWETTSATSSAALQVILSMNYNPRMVFWEQIVGEPEVFPPDLHGNTVNDTTGYADVIAAINAISTNVIANSGLNVHKLEGEPHPTARLTSTTRAVVVNQVSTPGGFELNPVVPMTPDYRNKLATVLDIVTLAKVIAADAAIGGATTNSPAFTGVPTAPTAAIDTANTTQIANVAFARLLVKGAESITGLTGGTYNLSAAQAENAMIRFSGTLTSNLTVRFPNYTDRVWSIENATTGPFTLTLAGATSGYSTVLVAQGKRNMVFMRSLSMYDAFNDFESVSLTGNPTATTQSASDNSTRIATTAFVKGAIGDKADIDSPTFTGTPAAPTPPIGISNTQIANADFVNQMIKGSLSKSGLTGGEITLTSEESENQTLHFSGALTSNIVIKIPTGKDRLWCVANGTTGAFTLTVASTTTGTSTVNVAQGKRNLIFMRSGHMYDGFNDFESIALTGIPTAPTASSGTNNTQIATTAFVNSLLKMTGYQLPTGNDDSEDILTTDGFKDAIYKLDTAIRRIVTTDVELLATNSVTMSVGPTSGIFKPLKGSSFMIQWGRFTFPSTDSSLSVVFPTAFSTKCVSVITNGFGDERNFSGIQQTETYVGSITTTGFYAYCDANPYVATYIAIGF